MLFNSLEYFVFLAVVLAIYYRLTHRWQNYFLLGASYFFYGWWDWHFLGLMLLSTSTDFFAAKWIHASSNPRTRKLLLIASVAINLSILGFFKYFNFFIDSAVRVLDLLGLPAASPALYIILPVGISFYTFESISYTVDVYRGTIKPAQKYLDYGLFIAYFPHLVAGPINRAGDFLPQIEKPRTVNTQMVVTGVTLILIGLFRKVVIADAIGGQVDVAFSNPGAQSTPQLMLGIYLFALQIYCDFAGYSDIARGSSRLFGIEMMRNFNQPYFSTSITEFWRRWHISLSTWLRDYLYIALGGNRKGTFNTYRNLFLTMLLGGLWHGAAWTFVIWGALQGVFLIADRLLGVRVPLYPEQVHQAWTPKRIAALVLTFHLVLLSWIFFRAPGLSGALTYLQQLFSFSGMGELPAVLPAIIIPWLLILMIDIPQYRTNDHEAILRWPTMARDLAVAGMLLLIILGFGTRAPFIYFQF
jgi:D-alanyl-lipoteichoic acid acyltransferase DltB (MBOAT superfamily)